MRGKQIKKRIPKPDEKYNSVSVARLINTVMYHGKKSIARKIVYTAFDQIGEADKKKKPLDVFENALKNLSPKVEVRSRRVGGANYQVPVPVPEYRQEALALRWLLDAARARRKTTQFKEALAEEIMDASNKSGEAYKKKEDTHRMADANKAFAHFSW